MRCRDSLVGVATVLALSLVPSAAKSQEHIAGHMGAPTEAAPFGSPVDDQHVWFHAILDQAEGRLGAEDNFHWDAEAWMGTDTHRLWLKSEGELGNGEVDEGEHEILYARPISTYFDVQAGARFDIDARPGRAWAALGVEGLAPNFFHVTATAYASDRGHFAAKFKASYDLLVTQRLILQPSVDVDLYSKVDPKRGVGSGFSALDIGLRLRYEVTRKFAPYIGLTYEKKLGQRGSLAALEGERTDLMRVVLGIRSWY